MSSSTNDLRLGVTGGLIVLALICLVLLFIHFLIAIVTYKRSGAVLRIFLLGLFAFAFAVCMLPDEHQPKIVKESIDSINSRTSRQKPSKGYASQDLD